MTEQEQLDLIRQNDAAQQQQGGVTPEEQAQLQLLHQNDPALGAYDPRRYNHTGQGMAALNNLGAVPSTLPPAKKNYSTMEMLAAIPGNFKDSASRLAQGVVQAVRHPIVTGEQLLGLAGGSTLNISRAVMDSLPPESQDLIRRGGISALNQLSPQVRAMVVQNSPELLQQMMDSATKLGGVYLDRYNGWENLRRTVAEDPVGFAADISSLLAPAAGLPGRAGAVAGAVADATNPIGLAGRSAGWLAERTGVADAARTVGGRVADTMLPSLADRRLWPSVEQAAQNNLIDRATEGNVEGVRNALQEAQEPAAFTRTGTVPGQTEGQIVPGTRPNSGQIIAGSDIAPAPPRSFAAMQQTANKNNATVADAQAIQNNGEMLNHLQPIGRNVPENTAAFGRPAPMTPAAVETGIETGARREYGAANRVVGTADAALLRTLEGPFSQLAEQSATRSAAQAHEPFWIGRNTPAVPAHSIPSSLLDAHGNPIMINVPAQPARFAQITGRNMQRVKEAFDSLIYGKGDAAAVNLLPNERAELLRTRNELVNWINDHNAPWETARQNYGIRSNILDRMNMGDSLRETLTNPLMGEDSATLNATAFGNALKEAPARTNSVVSKTKDKPRGDRLDNYLPPHEMERVNNVSDELGRSKMMEQQAKSGSAFSNALNTAGSDFIGGRLLSKIPFGDAVTDFLMHGKNQRIADRVGGAMFDPAEMEALLSQTLGRQNELAGARDWLMRRYAGTYGTLNRYPAIYNALNQDQPTP